MIDGAISLHYTVLQIYEVIFLPNIINIVQILTKLLRKNRGSSFYWVTVEMCGNAYTVANLNAGKRV